MANFYEIDEVVYETVAVFGRDGSSVNALVPKDAAQVRVRDAGTTNERSVYTAPSGTVLTQPLLTDNGRIEGFVSGETPVDLVVNPGQPNQYIQRWSPPQQGPTGPTGPAVGRVVDLAVHCVLNGVTDDSAGFAAALTAAGATGTLVGPAGKTLLTGSQLVIDGSAHKVSIRGEPGFTIKAGAAITGALLLYNKITDMPNAGVRGVILDMNNAGGGGASVGLEVRGCWLTKHDVGVVNVGGGVGKKFKTLDAAFGCYYNVSDGRVDGSAYAAGSIGVLCEGLDGGHQTNENVIRDRVGKCATGIKQGAFCQVNVLERSDCTDNTLNYDLANGTVLLRDIHDEAGVTDGIVVRTGVIARGTIAAFSAKRVEGTGILILEDQQGSANNTIDFGNTNSPNVDRSVNNTGSWIVIERHETGSGARVFLLDGVEKLRITRAGEVVSSDAARGIVLKDTQATPHFWRVTVSNTGVLTTTDLGTTRPS